MYYYYGVDYVSIDYSVLYATIRTYAINFRWVATLNPLRLPLSERSSGAFGATQAAGHDPSLAGRLRRIPAAGTSTAPVPLATAEPEHSCDTAIMPVLRTGRGDSDSVAPQSPASSLRARLDPESPSSSPVASRAASGWDPST